MATKDEKFLAVKRLERNGCVATADLIKAARDPDHACHDDFTWDVNKAAEERWHDQARAIIRQFHFEVQVEDVGPVQVSYYVSTPEAKTFRPLKAMRVSATSAVFEAELRQLLGVASRVMGIAEAKRGIVGDDAVVALRSICNSLRALLEN